MPSWLVRADGVSLTSAAGDIERRIQARTSEGGPVGLHLIDILGHPDIAVTMNTHLRVMPLNAAQRGAPDE